MELPSGGVVGLTLAAGISAALASARLHRRRRWQPQPSGPGVAHPDPLATDTVRRLHRAHLAATQPDPEDPLGQNGPDDADSAEPDAWPATDAATVVIGERDGDPIPMDLSRVGGLCLTGPAAAAVARAVIVDLLANRPPSAAELIIAEPAVADDLRHTCASLPNARVVEDIDAALSRLEAELLTRTRIIEDADAADFSQFARSHPQWPLPTLLLVTGSPHPARRTRLAVIADTGRRLGIAVLILGEHPQLPTLAVDAAARVLSVQPHETLPELADARLCTLTAEDAGQLLTVLEAGHDPPTDPTEPAEAEPVPPANQPAQPDAGTPITVRLLGPMDIHAAGRPIRVGLRRKARELLAYLLLHPQGATGAVAAEALWPDAAPNRSSEHFHTALGNLRVTLRARADRRDAEIVQRDGQHYQIDASLIDCDLWRFESALADAAAAPDDQAKTEALNRAVSLYHGQLVDGEDYDWAQPAREDLRRRVNDALAALADLHEQTGDVEHALAALDKGIRHDPYAEALYQRIMRLLARLGRPDAVRATYQRLVNHLHELQVDPHEDTQRLLRQLSKRPTPD